MGEGEALTPLREDKANRKTRVAMFALTRREKHLAFLTQGCPYVDGNPGDSGSLFLAFHLLACLVLLCSAQMPGQVTSPQSQN